MRHRDLADIASSRGPGRVTGRLRVLRARPTCCMTPKSSSERRTRCARRSARWRVGAGLELGRNLDRAARRDAVRRSRRSRAQEGGRAAPGRTPAARRTSSLLIVDARRVPSTISAPAPPGRSVGFADQAGVDREPVEDVGVRGRRATSSTRADALAVGPSDDLPARLDHQPRGRVATSDAPARRRARPVPAWRPASCRRARGGSARCPRMPSSSSRSRQRRAISGDAP